jgi:uncharacterized protein HemY
MVVVGLGIWAVVHWWPTRRHIPPAEVQALYDSGTEALRNGAYYRASLLLEQAIKADDEFALAHARLAEAATELEDGDKARDEMLRARDLIPDRSGLATLDALYLDAISATVGGTYRDAIKAYDALANVRQRTHRYTLTWGALTKRTTRPIRRSKTTRWPQA